MSVARAALSAFGRSGALRRVATGMDETYRVRAAAGEDLALRVGSTLPIRCRAAMEAEVAWLGALGRESPVAVPEVLAAPDGATVVTVRDATGAERSATLVRWLPGRKARWRFTTRHASALGAAAAQLHVHARSFVLPDGAWLKAWDRPKLCDRAGAAGLLRVVPSAGEVVDAIAARLDAAVADLGDHGWGVINADLGPHNVIFLGEEARLFDFNDMGWGYSTHDLARCARALRWRPTGEALVAALLDGYRSVAELPPGWSEHGAAFETAADLFLAGYLAGKVDERGPETLEVIDRLVEQARRFAG